MFERNTWHFVFFFNDTATTEIYTLFPTRRSSDLVAHRGVPVGQLGLRERLAASLEPRDLVDELAEAGAAPAALERSEEHTSELQSQSNLVCRLLLEKKQKQRQRPSPSAPTHD